MYMIFTFYTLLSIYIYINKRQSHPLVREGAPHGEGSKCQTRTNMWSWIPGPQRGPETKTDRQTDWLTDWQSQCDFDFDILTSTPLSFPKAAGHVGYLVSYWFAQFCVRANGYYRFILSHVRANEIGFLSFIFILFSISTEILASQLLYLPYALRCFLAWIILRAWRCICMYISERRLTFKGAISQMIKFMYIVNLFIRAWALPVIYWVAEWRLGSAEEF
jgi:hypothetical protein